MFISSEDSRDIFTNNSYFDFIVQLPSYVTLPECSALGWKQSWHIAITEISLVAKEKKYISRLPTGCTVLCNLVSDSYLRGRLAPVLRILNAESELTASLGLSYYMPVHSNARSFNEIRIRLTDTELKPLDFERWPSQGILSVALHFTRE